MMRYKTMLMDVDGTLLDFERAEKEGLQVVFSHYGLQPSFELEQQYMEINGKLWRDYEQGLIQRSQIMDTRFALFFETQGVKADGLEAEHLYREQLDNSAILIDGAHELCAYLKERYEMYVVTNGTSTTQYKRLKKSGLDQYFKDIFVSEDADSQKPQQAFFDYCFSKMEHPQPEMMLIIGDSLSSDIKGGMNAGTGTCWYNPTGTAKAGDFRVDIEIKDLLELKNIL